MSHLQEIDVLFQKRIAQLEKKKRRCMDYSSTPNRCIDKVEAQIARVRKLARVARFRKRTMESASLVDVYLETLDEIRKPSSPVARVVTVGLGAAGVYKGAKWKIMRDRCKDKKYSPYLYKRCMKGLEESELHEDFWDWNRGVATKAYTKYNPFRAAKRKVDSRKSKKELLKAKLKRQLKIKSKCKDAKCHKRIDIYIAKTKNQLTALSEAEGWEGMPRGWKQSSLAKFSKSLTGKKATQKGFFDKCVERMRGKLDNPEGFCASIKDERHGSTFWRGKGKTPQQAGKDVKRMQNVKRG